MNRQSKLFMRFSMRVTLSPDDCLYIEMLANPCPDNVFEVTHVLKKKPKQA